MSTTYHQSKETEQKAPQLQKAPELKIQAREAVSQQPGPHEAFARVMSPPTSTLMPADIMTLQRTVGNRAVQRMLAERSRSGDQEVRDSATAPAAPPIQDEPQEEKLLVVPEQFTPIEFTGLPDESSLGLANVPSGEPSPQEKQTVAAPPVGFHDLGRTGTTRFGDEQVLDKTHPHAFTDGGMTGTVAWAGGGGAGPRGNEAAGSIQAQVAPEYQATPVSGGTSTASVKAGTGTLDVTRSWLGANAGDQGTGWYVTAGAAARFNAHERLHVASSRGHYTTNIDPLLLRAKDTKVAATQAGAIAALTAHVNWATTVTAFQNADSASNAPMGTVDTADLASGTYPVDAGPGTVGGTAFAHRARLPTEPNPA